LLLFLFGLDDWGGLNGERRGLSNERSIVVTADHTGPDHTGLCAGHGR